LWALKPLLWGIGLPLFLPHPLQARSFLSGDKIFSSVDAGETKKAVDAILVIIRVFGRFKTVYLDYKVMTWC
jgi:hypothetical protein